MHRSERAERHSSVENNSLSCPILSTPNIIYYVRRATNSNLGFILELSPWCVMIAAAARAIEPFDAFVSERRYTSVKNLCRPEILRERYV